MKVITNVNPRAREISAMLGPCSGSPFRLMEDYSVILLDAELNHLVSRCRYIPLSECVDRPAGQFVIFYTPSAPCRSSPLLTGHQERVENRSRISVLLWSP